MSASEFVTLYMAAAIAQSFYLLGIYHGGLKPKETASIRLELLLLAVGTVWPGFLLWAVWRKATRGNPCA